MIMASRRNLALILVVVLLATTFVLYATTLRSMASVWFGSNNYLHGVLILPMSAYLVWHKRAQWMPVAVKPAIVGILLLLTSVLTWAVASIVSVQIVSQLAFIAMMGTVIWSVLGTRVAYRIQFPLLYAFFAVPFGEFLIPVLMDWTADFTVRALQISGIPVLREGHYFSLPGGNFEVVEACSGIRFLLVTVVLGLYFAHETYRSWTKRLIFVLLSAVSIIVANWARAYLVVLIAHLTDMQYGTGQDHIYFGWVIFLLLITLMFWVGRRYEDSGDDMATPHNESAARVLPGEGIRRRRDLVIAATFVVVILISGPVFLQAGRDRISGPLPQPALPMANGEWSGPVPVTLGYRPAFVGGTEELAGQYSNGLQLVELHVVFYSEQQQGNELVGWRSKLFDANNWRSLQHNKVRVTLSPDDGGFEVQNVLITDGKRLLRLWQWYDVGGFVTSRAGVAKLRQAWNMITGYRQGDALFVLAMPVFVDRLCFTEASDDSGREN